jgi:hypothetical protein
MSLTKERQAKFEEARKVLRSIKEDRLPDIPLDGSPFPEGVNEEAALRTLGRLQAALDLIREAYAVGGDQLFMLHDCNPHGCNIARDAAVRIDEVGSLEEAIDLAAGRANADAPHLTVPFYMPLAQGITLEDGLRCVSPQIRERVRQGKAKLLALAHGQMVEPGEQPRTVQYVLLHGVLEDGDDPMHFLFDTIESEVEEAVLMDGDGLRHGSP